MELSPAVVAVDAAGLAGVIHRRVLVRRNDPAALVPDGLPTGRPEWCRAQWSDRPEDAGSTDRRWLLLEIDPARAGPGLHRAELSLRFVGETEALSLRLQLDGAPTKSKAVPAGG
jgi:hypothetical protein